MAMSGSPTSSTRTSVQVLAEFKALIDQTKETEALALLKTHLTSFENKDTSPLFHYCKDFLSACKSEALQHQVACLFLEIKNDYLREQVLKFFGDDTKLLAFITKQIAAIVFENVDVILRVCKTDQTRLQITRLFADKFDATKDGYRIAFALRAFQQDAARLECAESYIDKIQINDLANFIKSSGEQSNRLQIALKSKDKFAYPLSCGNNVPQYLEVLAVLEEEQRVAFVKACVDIIPPDTLQRVVEKITVQRGSVAYNFHSEQQSHIHLSDIDSGMRLKNITLCLKRITCSSFYIV